MSVKTLIDSLIESVDDILVVRSDLGAAIDVYLIERIWSGENVGDGIFEDRVEKIFPAPNVVDYGHDLRIQLSGAIKQGDLLVKDISKHGFPNVESIDGTSTNKQLEHLYKIKDDLYQVIHVKDNYVTWDVQVRKIAGKE